MNQLSEKALKPFQNIQGQRKKQHSSEKLEPENVSIQVFHLDLFTVKQLINKFTNIFSVYI